MGRVSRAPSEVDRWKAAVLTLPDDSFFAIVRNYLGELRTPFNKHSLIEELLAFAGRAETIERMLAIIDEDDIRLLSAIEILGEPDIDRLFAFFGGSLGYLELHHLILNLEERLLVYRDRSRGPARLVFTPLLKERLLKRIDNPHLLFPSYPAGPPVASGPWLTDFLLIALFAFLLGARGAVRNDGTLRKRTREELAGIIPPLAAEGRLEIVLRALRRLSLLEVEEGELVPRVDRFRSLAELDPRSRLATVWSAAMDERNAAIEEPADGSRQSIEAVIHRRAVILSGVLETMAPDRAYPIASLTKIAVASDAQGRSAPLRPESLAGLIHGMAALGLLIPAHAVRAERGESAKNDEPLYRRSESAVSPPAREERSAILEPNFLVTAKPTIPFEQAIELALACELRRYDVYAHYEITKESFMRALEHGLPAVKVEALFESLSGTSLPQNVRFTLDSWQRELEGVSLSSGVVLTADAERRHLIEHSESMQPYLKRILAPGVYLLDPAERREWEEALRHAGIAPLPAIRPASTPRGPSSPTSFRAIAAAPPLALSGPADHRTPGREQSAIKETASDELRRGLLRQLDSLSVPDDQRAEIVARINKKLILYPSQLVGLAGRIERSEAKGLDYVGKIRLIEQAVGSETDLLEILERRPKGEARRLLVKAVRLERAGNDLLLSAKALPEETEVKIKVRKIGLVRKLRGSLFAP